MISGFESRHVLGRGKGAGFGVGRAWNLPMEGRPSSMLGVRRRFGEANE